ncbi:putative tRNA (cytidine(34)-2'-o)-methyltransferase [Phtheirospermum japonicum]|uniref:Putative tRNA (Cytidine(34)-2'-o)-methyltransferase n=1 Tax=Phtheirospermum japonicum TaxID=374723 RepID=A0A830C1Y0_9LAMI|nr:putative tRNA (cytidine(34)-2'-o)-methyltransferase [Phtheirospermum japonicum]
MDPTGLRALNAITSSSLPLLLHFRSTASPLLRRRHLFSAQNKSNLSRFPLSLSSPLCSSSERDRADVSSNGFGVSASKFSLNKEFLQVVLVSPQIPGNTGCIARTCAASAVKLHLVEVTLFRIFYQVGDWLVFGSETSGLPPEALDDCKSESLGGGTIKIPMVETYVRCLNLSVSAGIALYEASRQLNYEHLQISSEPCMITETPLLTEDIFA